MQKYYPNICTRLKHILCHSRILEHAKTRLFCLNYNPVWHSCAWTERQEYGSVSKWMLVRYAVNWVSWNGGIQTSSALEQPCSKC